MTDNIDRLYEPDKDEGDYFEFITLSGGLGAFDIEAAAWWGGRHDTRLDELVFRIQEGRWVLVYAPVPGHENYGAPQPLSRELTPVEAARWFQINRRKLPKELTPIITGSRHEPQGEPTRLDREWRPPVRSATLTPAPPHGSSAADSPDRDAGQGGNSPKVLMRVRIIAMHAKQPGLSNAEIARRLSCNPGTVSRALREVREAEGEASRRDVIRQHEDRGGPKAGHRRSTHRHDARDWDNEEDGWDTEEDDD
jgi:hypothetical protein